MKYAVIYQSESGNTRQVAEEIYESLSAYDKEIYDLDELSELPEADVYLIGFGIRNGSCGINVIKCLEQITDGYYALFATCGLLATDQYKAALEKKLEVWLPENAEYLGMFLCQGHTGEEQQRAITACYPNNTYELEKIFQFGETHPDDSDFRKATHFAQTVYEQLEYGH